jgi:hypothetical protein
MTYGRKTWKEVNPAAPAYNHTNGIALGIVWQPIHLQLEYEFAVVKLTLASVVADANLTLCHNHQASGPHSMGTRSHLCDKISFTKRLS